MITISKENYLKAIFEAESKGEHVISAMLATDSWFPSRSDHGDEAIKALRHGFCARRRSH